jgi:uroporphyrinogen-III decarboxylase
MMDWGEEQNANFAQYFDYVNINRAVRQIADGLISPWIILNCKSGTTMLSKFNDEQLDIVSPIIDPPYWMKRFKTYPSEIALVKEICKETGIA